LYDPIGRIIHTRSVVILVLKQIFFIVQLTLLVALILVACIYSFKFIVNVSKCKCCMGDEHAQLNGERTVYMMMMMILFSNNCVPY